jgi:hypothetical protein
MVYSFVVDQSSMTKARAFDTVSTDGRAIRRGYIELVLDRGPLADDNTDETQADSISLYLIDISAHKAPSNFVQSFPTRIPHDISNDARKAVTHRLMDYLTDTLTVSTFTSEIENDKLESFGKYAAVLTAE